MPSAAQPHWTTPPAGAEPCRTCPPAGAEQRRAAAPPWTCPSAGVEPALELARRQVSRAGRTRSAAAPNDEASLPVPKRSRAGGTDCPGLSWLTPPAGESGCSRTAAETENQEGQREWVALDVAPLLMLKGVTELSSSSHGLSTYARKSMDPQRIANVLARGCSCSFRCMETLRSRVKDVVLFCKLYFSLPVSMQSEYVRNSAKTENSNFSDDIGPRTKWLLLGHRVSMRCLNSILGINNHRFYRLKSGALGGRTLRSFRHKPQSLIVNQFFAELYSSTAERLPETDVSLDIADHNTEDSFADPFAAVVLPDWNPNEVATDLINRAEAETLPKRHLQHGSIGELFWQFLAWFSAFAEVAPATGMICPSMSLFKQHWHGRWKSMLRFRKRTQHTQCNFCFECQQFLRNTSVSVEQKAAKAKEWREHLQRQYMDRALYWHMRWFSRLRTFKIVTVIIDGLDKVKGVWPQYGFRPPKCLDRFIRPELRITASYAHGFCCCFFLAHDELTPGGASHYCDVLCRTIEKSKTFVEKRIGRLRTSSSAKQTTQHPKQRMTWSVDFWRSWSAAASSR